MGGSEMFDTLADLVEFYKRKGVEEISGNWVYLKQVWELTQGSNPTHDIVISIILIDGGLDSLLALLLHPRERGRHRQEGEAVGSDGWEPRWGREEEQGRILGGVWRTFSFTLFF